MENRKLIWSQDKKNICKENTANELVCPTSNSKRKPSIICVVFHTGKRTSALTHAAKWGGLTHSNVRDIIEAEDLLRLSNNQCNTFPHFRSLSHVFTSLCITIWFSAQFHCHVSKMSNLMYGRQKEANTVFKKLNVNVVITIRQRSKHGRQQLVAEWCAQRFLSPLIFKLPHLFERKALNH